MILPFFSESRFLGLAYFQYSVFKGRVSFDDSIFKKRTAFNNTVFEKGDQVIFNNINLSMVSFKNTDITRINFGYVQWRSKSKIIDEEDLEWSLSPVLDLSDSSSLKTIKIEKLTGFLRHNGIIENDELHLEKENEKIIIFNKSKGDYIRIGSVIFSGDRNHITLQIEDFLINLISLNNDMRFFTPEVEIFPIVSIYRNLRENYEYRLRYEEAGRFFIREMEIKRNYQEVRET